MRFQNSNDEMYNACLCVSVRVYVCILRKPGRLKVRSKVKLSARDGGWGWVAITSELRT